MASFDLSEEINCSICLDIYTDPVMLPCGHNFCQGCIKRVLDTQEGTGGYSCPECREEYEERPVLQRNRTLGNIAERFLPGQLEAGEAGVPCTYCVHSPVSAVKSCLHCETSLCDVHLTAHNKSLEHVLTDPTNSFSNRKCSTHKELLKYYCLEDKACICSSCCLAGEHRGHRVELLSEASEKKKENVRKVLEKLSPEREETERGAQRLQERRREVEEKVAGETERVTALFRDIREKVEALEKRFLDEISSQKEKLSSRLRDLMEQLEIKKEELSRKIRHIEELCNMADPLTVLQERESHGVDFCGAEVGNDDEGGEEGLNSFVELASDEEQYSDQFYSDDEELYLHYEENEEATNLAALDEDLHLLLRHLNEVVTGVNEIIIGQEATDLVLDINTAANDVTVSSDGKYVYYTCNDQCRPQTPERFQSSQVLSSRSFISGRHYWDIAVDEYVCWKVGVAYPSIEREGDQSLFGENHVSWCLGSYGNDYVVQHMWNVARLWRSSTCSRIRISVDCEAGFLSFYELNETVRHLYTFTVSFTEPLHAAFSVWDGYEGLKIIS